MLENYVKVSFAEIALETKLSELSARTVAMEDAAAKTEKLIKKTTLGYSKERRESETQKQLESFSAHKIL